MYLNTEKSKKYQAQKSRTQSNLVQIQFSQIDCHPKCNPAQFKPEHIKDHQTFDHRIPQLLPEGFLMRGVQTQNSLCEF